MSSGGGMTPIGRVHSLWRYPVKSMRGEQIDSAFVGFSGVYGDRIYAFRIAGGRAGFPYLSGCQLGQMLLYQPLYRDAEKMKQPPNLTEAQAIPPGVTPVYASADERALDVRTPSGQVLAIDDPRLITDLSGAMRDGQQLSLVHSDRAMTDCRPVSLFAIQTARQMSTELGSDLDLRRFRANIYLDLHSGIGFEEDRLVGRTLRIGEKTVVAITERDPRCKMITLDPETALPDPEIMKRLAQEHDSNAGVYTAVLVEGIIRSGDPVVILN